MPSSRFSKINRHSHNLPYIILVENFLHFFVKKTFFYNFGFVLDKCYGFGLFISRFFGIDFTDDVYIIRGMLTRIRVIALVAAE